MITQLLLVACLLGSAPDPEGGIRVLRARRVKTPPRIDGYLTERCWKVIEPTSGFTQYSPHEGVPSEEMTYVYSVYDEGNIYFAFVCRDSEPHAMSTKIAPREAAEMGDAVAVFLDTFHDRQNAFLFQTNAMGVQLDARISEDGNKLDQSWDGLWRAEGRLTTTGWVVEIEIPFNTLRFPYSSDQLWGVQFWRYIERLNETSYWVPVTRAEGFGISRFGRLTGIKDIRHPVHMEVLPYAVGRTESTDSQDLDAEADCGLDLKWGVAPDLTLDATVNPDFGQIEADPETINLSRYEYYLPERRPFFMEGKELLDSLFFYTRRVGKRLPDGTEVPILGGARVTGKAYQTSFLLAAAATEGARSDSFHEQPALYSVAKVALDVLGSSNFGFTVSGKDTVGGHARCTAFDTRLSLLSRTDMTLRLAKTWNTNPSLEGYLGEVGADFRSADFGLGATYRDVGRDFYVEEFGYAPYYGTKSHTSYVRFHPRVNRAGITSYSISLNYMTDKRYEHPVWSHYAGPTFTLSFTNLWHPWVGGYFGEKYEAGSQRPYSYIYAGILTDYRRALSATVSLNQYSTYNYSKEYFGHHRTGYIELELRPATNIRLSGRIDNIAEYRSDWSLDMSSWTAGQRLELSITRDILLRLYALENTHTERYTGSGLIEWAFAPRSRIYLAFNEVRNDSWGDMRLEDRIGFLKVSYLISL